MTFMNSENNNNKNNKCKINNNKNNTTKITTTKITPKITITKTLLALKSCKVHRN